jgi:uncharacterized protein (DUF486 family)
VLKQIAEFVYKPTDRETERAQELFQQHKERAYVKADHMFAMLMAAQWVFGILVALIYSPYAWSGKSHVINQHVYIAVLVGGGISLFPIALALLKPGAFMTRHVIAASQMLWSALLIHLTGGRIETHFHVFGSLAFVAFYLDWTVLVTATLVVAGEHLLRGIVYPESVYGIVNPEWWRFLEHAFWVVFCDVVLVWGCLKGTKEMREVSQLEARLETTNESLYENDRNKTAAVEMMLAEMQAKGTA